MKESLKKFYEKKYKILMIIPFILFGLAIVSIAFTMINYGDVVQKDVSLSGGISYDIRVDNWNSKTSTDVVNELMIRYSEKTYSVTDLKNFGERIGFSLMVDLDSLQEEEFEEILNEVLTSNFNEGYSIASKSNMSGTIADDFFKTTFKFLIYAFLFMGAVVFLYFRKFAPSVSIILSSIFDIIITIGFFNLFQMKLSMAGVAAILMLVGYSVDTNILLTTKLIKEKPKNIQDGIYDAMKTGLKMTSTTIGVLIAVFFVSQAPAIKQIVTILLIGLIVDLMSTWFMNAGILKIYLSKKGVKK
ncbi:MAG: hypothetical protein PHT94_01285 [Candidatus Nanoarchaeia archaeon]|nr:hypothetical protein [Candidatus Nanoarchaeia archaeon]